MHQTSLQLSKHVAKKNTSPCRVESLFSFFFRKDLQCFTHDPQTEAQWFHPAYPASYTHEQNAFHFIQIGAIKKNPNNCHKTVELMDTASNSHTDSFIHLYRVYWLQLGYLQISDFSWSSHDSTLPPRNYTI